MKQEGKPHSRFGRTRKWLIFWTLFIGLGAVGGAAMMLLDPSGRSVGMDGLLLYFQAVYYTHLLPWQAPREAAEAAGAYSSFKISRATKTPLAEAWDSECVMPLPSPMI